MSLKKIAALAGTSAATVSRVLNHPEHKCNDPELQKKIWQLADELHYTPNATARNLRNGGKPETEPFTIDVFLTRFHSIENDAFFMELFQIIKEEILANGCVFGQLLTHIDIPDLGKPDSTTKHIPYKSTSKVQQESGPVSAAWITSKPNTGLVILGKCQENLIPLLQKRYPCIVGIDRNPTDYLYDEIFCNGTSATEQAMEYLISLNHRKIAYIGDCNYESRYIGYYQTMLNHKFPIGYDQIYPTDQTREQGYQTMLQILAKPDRPTAIFCANDTTALGVLEALKKKRHKGYAPSVISIDDIEAAKHSSPMLTTISIPKQEMGHLALWALLDRMAGHHSENIRIELPCHLVIRESCEYHY